MDQVKKYLAVAVKHGFWIGTATIFIGSLLVWYLSTSSLSTELDSRTQKINSSVSQVSQTRSQVPTAPNPTSHAEMDRMIKARTNEVVDAWTRMYDRQRAVLTWPRKELLDDFVAEFENKIPIEKYVAFPTLEQDEVDPSIRRRYRDYIDRILPGLAEIAKAKWSASFDAVKKFEEMNTPGSRRPQVNVTGVDEEIPLVQWGSGSQSAVLSDLFPWRGSKDGPTTLEVYYSQENIWILKQLLQIVADVNGDAEMPFQAKIREIKQLAIGSSADFSAGDILKPGELFGGGGGLGGDGGDFDDSGDYEDDGGGGEMDEDGFGSSSYGPTSDPGDSRYVNTQLGPITGAQLRSALVSNSPDDANIAVAKRVPVMMSFQMDQRHVPELIAACGNADLMVEVRQVRILPSAGAGYSGAAGGSVSDEESSGGDEGDESGGGYMPISVKATPQKEFPYDMEVQVYGLIYIYNPPQAAALGVESVDQNTVIEGEVNQDPLPAPAAAVPTPPAPATPAPATPAPATEAPAAETPETQTPPVAAPPTAISTP